MPLHELAKSELLSSLVAHELHLLVNMAEDHFHLVNDFFFNMLRCLSSTHYALDLSQRHDVETDVAVLRHDLLESTSAVDISQQLLLVEEDVGIKVVEVPALKASLECVQIKVLALELYDALHMLTAFDWGKLREPETLDLQLAALLDPLV